MPIGSTQSGFVGAIVCITGGVTKTCGRSVDGIGVVIIIGVVGPGNGIKMSG